MNVTQFVMAYGVEQDRLRAILPEGFVSLRPVLRINAEVRDGTTGYVEFNTAVEKDGVRGWLNIGCWEGVPFRQEGKTTVFEPEFLTIFFTGVGVEGSCPAEKDNGGCYFPDAVPQLRAPEIIDANKEFCDCAFAWHFPKTTPTASASERRCPPSPRRCRRCIPVRRLRRPTPRPSPASRCWAPTW